MSRTYDEREIVSVMRGSPADEAGLRPGDIVLSVNGNRIYDRLDFEFYTAGEDFVEIVVRRAGQELSFVVHTAGGDIGVELAPLRPRRCGNNCIFCFVDQLPPGLRSSLYFKDGDFRFSFLEGSYITLTNLTPADWRRIFTQKMSPLYVSVHATDEVVRRALLGRKNIPPIMDQLSAMAEHGIDFHAQIVLVPGYNDGEILVRTVEDLFTFGEHLLSLAVVPVGLTEHRQNLPHIDPVSPELARRIIDWHWEYLRRNRSARGILQLADEFFLLAGREIPPADYYANYPQYENGVGMVRDFLDSVPQWGNFSGANPPRRVGIITGTLFAPVFERTGAKFLAERFGIQIEVIPQSNTLFGKTVTVANLLPGRDIAAALKKFSTNPEIVIIPPRTVNRDNLFLDDVPLSQLVKNSPYPIVRAPEDPREFVRALSSACAQNQ